MVVLMMDVDIVFLNIVDALLLIMIDHDDKDEFKIAVVGDLDIGVTVIELI